jgi:hypothetical protein
MDKTIAGEHEQWEYHSLAKAAAIHQQAARIFEEHGMRRYADEEWGKWAIIRRAINSWIETWTFPDKPADRTAAYKEDKSTQIENLRQMMLDHHMVDKSVAASLAENVVRSNRDLATLAAQKGWLEDPNEPKIDGATLAIGCEKLRRLGIRPGYERFVDRLEQLARGIGVDEDMFEAAKDFMDEQELEEEWERQRA